MPRTLESAKHLEDWRVGDIALCPDGVERTIHECNDLGYWVLSDEGCDSLWKQLFLSEGLQPLRNPEFLVGDMVRGRNPHVQGKWRWFQIDVSLTNPDRFALIERAQVAEKKPRAHRMDVADKYLREGVDRLRKAARWDPCLEPAVLDALEALGDALGEQLDEGDTE